jgi:hypothetical protein
MKWTGKAVSHDTCPLRDTLVCRRCCARGHSSSECSDDNIWHPFCLEELIPIDLREKYHINTQTEYTPPQKPIDPHPTRFLDIVNDDKWLRKFMKNQHMLKNTARKCEENLARVQKWASDQGLCVRILSKENIQM